MLKNKKLTFGMSLLLLALDSFSNELVYDPSDIYQREDMTLVTEVLIQNSERIKSIEERMERLEKNMLHKSTTKNKPNAKVVNVKEFANFRESPFGVIKTYIPLGTLIHIESCNSVWCESTDFGGGYIAKSLLELDPTSKIKFE